MSTINSLCRPLSLIAAMMLVLSCAVFAQDTGNLYGTVTDSNGEELPNVTLGLSSAAAAQSQLSDADGEFRFLNLKPGSYVLEAVLDGYATELDAAITIRAGRDTTIEVMMTPAIIDDADGDFAPRSTPDPKSEP